MALTCFVPEHGWLATASKNLTSSRRASKLVMKLLFPAIFGCREREKGTSEAERV